MPSKVIVDVEVPQPPAQASTSASVSSSVVPSASASAPSPSPSQPIAIDDDDAASDTAAVRQVEKAAIGTKTKKKNAGSATKRSNKAAAAAEAQQQQQQQDVPSSASDAKTVTPKAESKKKKKKSSGGGAGRSKKSTATELPANQRTLGSFFGAPAAARTKKKAATGTTVKAKSVSASAKAGSNDAAASSAAEKKVDDTTADASLSTTESTDAENMGTSKKKNTTGSGKANTTTTAKKAKKKSATTKATKAKTKSKKCSSTAPPPSEEIKAIVLGSAYKKKSSTFGTATSTTTGTSSSSTRPSAELPTKQGMIDPITSTAGVGIPCSLILNQRQIKEQEEKARAEREKAEAKAEAKSTSKKDAEAVTAVEEQDATANAVNSLPSSSFISPTPAKKKKKAKKRATLIPVTTAPAAPTDGTSAAPVNKDDSNASAADDSSKPNADGDRGEEESTGPKPAMELDDDATVDMAPMHDNEDGESLHSEEDDIMSVDEGGMVEPDEHPDIDPVVDDDGDDDQDAAVVEISLTGTAAKGSAVEGTRVLDLTLGEESGGTDGDDATCNDAGASQAAEEVSKRLSFTPKKKKADAATAGKGAVKVGGLDAFAVPISSIKASKEAKKKAEPTKKSTTPAQSGSSYVNKRIAKEFDNGIVYRGTVTKCSEDGSADGLWHILYDDGDEEDFSLSELEAGMKLFESESKKVPDGAKRAAPKTAAAPIEVEPELPEEFQAVLAKHETLRKRYRMRAEDLVNRSTELVEEDFDRVVQPKEDGAVCAPKDGSFPEALRQELAVLIQGSPLPLSILTTNAVTELAKLPAGKNLTADIVSDKIKIMAARKQYLATLSPSAIQVDRFEDTQADLVWRWELSTLDLLPSELISKAKKAQAGRRKLQNFHKAVVKLLASLDKADALFLNANSPKVKRDAALAKVSTDEDKVLKYERDEEKQRLAREAKAKKEAEKERAKQQKEQQKKLAAEKKEQEKKLAAEEKEQQKKLAAEEKEEQKKLAAAKREEEREVSNACGFRLELVIWRLIIRIGLLRACILSPL